MRNDNDLHTMTISQLEKEIRILHRLLAAYKQQGGLTQHRDVKRRLDIAEIELGGRLDDAYNAAVEAANK